MQLKKISISFFLLFTALMLVNTSFAATHGAKRLSHFVSVHKHTHSESTSKDFFLASDIQNERTNDEYKKRLALFRLSVGKSLLSPQVSEHNYSVTTISSYTSKQVHVLPDFRWPYIYPFHYFW